MKLWESYHIPSTTSEALALLERYQGQARVVAGGTDLLVEAKAETHAPFVALIDITRIPELMSLEVSANEVIIGAGATHAQIVKHPVLASRATCLVESCGVVGGPQVRNVATLGGNVAHALPAADGTTSLIALDAQAEVIIEGQRRWLPLKELFLGPGKSALNPARDLLVRFRLALCGTRQASAFKRIMRPQGVALPILGCAAWVELDETGQHFASARVSIAPIGPTPARASEVEAQLVGQPTDEATIERVAHWAQAALHPRTSKYRATADYRREMIGVLLRRTLGLAVERARTGQAIPQGVGL
ncbi:MAG: xanthine dehydrogenase family protein subunit M [Anaerolineae bacterium]|nr:xanthine dehydrogenase family protein subunit M [Anaerolineae bacterium]MDW8172019.1 xanthine dehydrogenase family protein subunit M [Anaerolineae bacterium]